jgi:hypothetical protein
VTHDRPPPTMHPPDEPVPPPATRARRASERPTLHAGPMSALPQRAGGTPPPPEKLPRGSAGLRAALPGSLRQAPLRPAHPSTALPALTKEAGGPIRTLIFAPEPNRARWIESELSQPRATVLEGEPRSLITIQLGRRVRTVVFALLKDPPPRPQVLIVDFDAVSAAELFELHAIRHDGWTGRLIGLGSVPQELVISLEIEQVFTAPFVRDSLLDCVAGTRHAAVTVTIPVIPAGEEQF